MLKGAYHLVDTPKISVPNGSFKKPLLKHKTHSPNFRDVSCLGGNTHGNLPTFNFKSCM